MENQRRKKLSTNRDAITRGRAPPVVISLQFEQITLLMSASLTAQTLLTGHSPRQVAASRSLGYTRSSSEKQRPTRRSLIPSIRYCTALLILSTNSLHVANVGTDQPDQTYTYFRGVFPPTNLRFLKRPVAAGAENFAETRQRPHPIPSDGFIPDLE
ncbi:hypothetical protein K0M31_012134 [Melipona bicolor]|uniref:Uncharacterized protein n=1 Tax=Melipona bicolor TaxID=60889 RepID=A0AA40GB66_9HYME|nr:hypothetical protein K0M31_012134 [Melipona bicolor]